MNIKKRLEKVEAQVKTDTTLPVLFIDQEEETDHYKDIGSNTVIFLDDIGKGE